MITICTDIDFITRCVTHPKVWSATADDGCGSPDLCFITLNRSVTWLRSDDDGVFMLHPHNAITVECHTLLLPSAYGRAVEIAKEAIQWVWNNTPAERIVTNVPEFNHKALRLALRCGFVEYGNNPRSFKKDGAYYSQKLLGISKGE